LKELNETAIWLLMIMKAGMAPAALITDALNENRQLSRILNASAKTAQSTRNSNRLIDH